MLIVLGMGRDRYMIGPDGTEYKWVIGFGKPKVSITNMIKMCIGPSGCH